MVENYFGLTDTGRVRSNNEDTFIAQSLPGSGMLLAGVIDGVGGYDGGEIAAETAREQFVKQLSGNINNWEQGLIKAFEQANHEIYVKRQQVKELDSMACVATAAVVDIANNQFYYAHVGDTRLYLMRDQSLVKITKDHSFVGFLEDSGRLSETAAMNHPKRNEINKALGFNDNFSSEKSYVETGQSPFLPGDVLLLCSDGLTDMVDKNDITAILTSAGTLQHKTQQLIDAANRNGGRDNVTAVLVQNDKAPVQQSATMPVTNAQKPVEPVIKTTPVSQPVEAESHYSSAPQPKNSNALVIILSVLCVMLLAAVAWLYWQNTQRQVAPVQPVAVANNTRNAQEMKLQDTLNNLKGDTLTLTAAAFPQPVLISDTLKIKKDTLYIKTQGKVQLTRDSAYNGPAMALAPNCKVIVIKGLVFNNFNVGISAHNNALFLTRVQFVNCTYPVQVNYISSDQQPVSGNTPAINLKADTTTTNRQPHGAK